MRIAPAFGAATRVLLCCALISAAPLAPVAVAQTASSRPTWTDLTPLQREALAPLAADWAAMDADRKRKWLEVAAKYPNMSNDGRKLMQQRMAEFAKLTPEQKKTARENFKRAYELPADQRQAKVQKFQELPDDKKRELADRAAAKKAAPTRRSTREPEAPPAKSPPVPGTLDVPPARPPAQTEKVGG